MIQTDWKAPAHNLSASIHTWLAAATLASPRSYLLVSQNHGGVDGGADLFFPTGPLERDFLGIQSMGPRDFATEENPVTPIAGIAVDPISGFLAAEEGNLEFFYAPLRTIGFDNGIDALVVDPGGPATAVFRDASSADRVLGVRAKGEGWKTAFRGFDPFGLEYAAPGADPQDRWWIVDLMGQWQPWDAVLDWFEAPVEPVTSVDSQAPSVPSEFRLHKVYPNPFRNATQIRFDLISEMHTRLAVHNIRGKR